jgi:SAM-dependent methyltransferase
MTTMPTVQWPPAAQRWAAQIASIAVPDHIRDAAPEPRWGLSVERFARIADETVAQSATRSTPSQRLALEALPEGGTVLDVGCGGGAASLPLASRAGRLIGFDGNPGMLAAFAERAEALGIAFETIEGRWPDAADSVPTADVVVSNNVVYGVSDLAPFLVALGEHARHRVVLQMTDGHPLGWMQPYWQALHGIELPTGPLAEDLHAVAAELGFEPGIERWSRPWRGEDFDAMVERVRQRLCLPHERLDEVRAAVRATPPPSERGSATVWWTPRP